MVLIWGKQHFANLGTTDQRQASSVMFQLRISAGLIPARKLNHTERPDVMESLDQLHLITRRCVGEAGWRPLGVSSNWSPKQFIR
jgi:hypothetical protein